MYNICVIEPNGYPHSRAFDELSQLLTHAFRQLGISCSLSKNHIDRERTNIVIGSHLINSADLAALPQSTIILNTEQLYSGQNMQWSDTVTNWGRRYFVWDYNNRNIANLKERGVTNAVLLKIGYQAELNRIPRASAQDIDVLFYGSINHRRSTIIDELRNEGLNVKVLFGVYGQERDNEIARSKIVLNMHFYDQKIFEIVRVFYLMTNSKAVVAEVGSDTSIEPRFLNGIAATPYENIVATCKRLANNEAERRHLEEAALNSIHAWPQADFLRETLALTEERRPTVNLPTAERSDTGPARNQPCPCGSGKRYKHCHGAYT